MARAHAPVSPGRMIAAPGAALVLVLVLELAGALAPLDRGWFDLLQRQFAARAPIPEDTAIVLIDEQSLTAMGEDPFNMRWPWPRGAFAALIAGLYRAGATSIAVDLIFFENSEAAEQDALLGAVAAGLPEVTLGASPRADGKPEQLPVVWPSTFRAEHAGLFSGKTRWGFVRPVQDPDGVIRRYRLGGSFAEAALGIADEVDSPAGDRLLRWRGSLETLRTRGVPLVPAAPFVSAGWEMLERAAGASPDLDPLALARAIDAEPTPMGEIFELVHGRRVLVGANAAATFDYVATPVGAPEPGVLLQWTALAAIEADDFLAEAGGIAKFAALFVVIGAIAFFGRQGTGLSRPAFAAAAAAGVTIAGSAAAFLLGVWFAPALPAIGAGVAFTAVAVHSFRRERARKHEIQGWFGAYVSPAVVQRLVEDPEALRLGGERREISVFFSDFAGFTTLSEKLPAEELITLTNTCLEELSTSIFDHGGYLDKYIGDAIMGIFGVPEALENHALSACRAALDCQRRLAVLNERFAVEYGLRLGMRVGVNTGVAVVGNVGSERKKNYTALGDMVNLASRLEGANKEFHTPILIGPLTAARVSGEIITRPVALLQVKGKTQAVEVHEPLAEITAADEATRRFAAACKEGFDAWCGRRFEQAIRAYAEAVDLRPGDFPATRYLAEARRLSAAPTPADWQPILVLDSK